jgi:NAD(P)-dependent dehydrogenase (short-subunit alcohol dehydrogenase family)
MAKKSKLRLKPLDEQVIVITGASSGIGLVTAKMAAERGASVVLSARNRRALADAVDRIESAGGRATYVVADVADAEDMEQLAEEAVREFGRIDSWVNNASVAIYGRLDEVQLEDKRRLFDVNFWGVVHGCRAALPHMREHGGALINVGSVVSERAIPLQGAYVAAKHAVKGYTDTLRMELEEEGAPISVTLVKPASIDTPFFEHARSYMEADPKPVPPVYAPDVVAEVILEAAQRPMRDVYAGGAAKMMSAMEKYAPRITDVVFEKTQFESQKYKDRPATTGRRDNLYEPLEDDGGERGRYDGRVMKSSAYSRASTSPLSGLATALGLGLVVAAGVRALRGGARDDELLPDEDELGVTGAPPGASARSGTGVADSAEGLSHVPR